MQNTIYSDLKLDRGNFNRYCNDNFQHIDATLIIKLCNYFNCGISDLLEIREKPDSTDETALPLLKPLSVIRKPRN